MKGNWKWVSGALLTAIIVVGMIAPRIRAGSTAVVGAFKLPFNAKWGQAALPTGDYTFEINNFSSQGLIAVYQGTRSVAVMFPESFDEYRVNKGKDFELLCIRHDGKVAVRALQTDLGTFYFPLPKELKLLLAQQPQLIETVPVQVGE